MLRRFISALLGIDRVRARLRLARLLLEPGGLLRVLGVLGLRPQLLGRGGALLHARLRVGGGLAALRLGGGLRLRTQAVALRGLLALLGGQLVLEPAALGLVSGLLVLDGSLRLGLARLGALAGGVAVGVDGGLLEPALARQVVVAEQRAGDLLRLSSELAGDAAGHSLPVCVSHFGCSWFGDATVSYPGLRAVVELEPDAGAAVLARDAPAAGQLLDEEQPEAAVLLGLERARPRGQAGTVVGHLDAEELGLGRDREVDPLPGGAVT